MAVALTDLLDDLAAETEVVDSMIAPLADADWQRDTPAAGWAIRDQVSHLAYFDEAAALAVRDPQRFRAEAALLTSNGADFPDMVARRYRETHAASLLDWFRRARRELLDTFAAAQPKERVPWYGPDMSVTSSATARLMETWAHGQDVVDALGTRRTPTARLRHVAHLGIVTFGFVFQLHGRAAPGEPVHVRLAAPDGDTWTWGPADAPNAVSGLALDFCLAVTQRRHVADTALRVDGDVAREWMSIAQAFAGAPGSGRKPGEFPT